MRLAVLLASTVVLTTVACAAPDDLDEQRASATSDLVNGGDYSACSLSRSAILASTSPARQRAIQRGFSWLDTNVQYSQSASHQGYRTDCSGFVSMCWELGSSPNTASFMAGTGKATPLPSYDDILPGDAFIRSGHAALFLGWEDAAHTSACIIELASTASDMKFRSRTTSALKSSGTKAFRADYLAGDLGVAQGQATEDADPTPTPTPTTEDDPPAEDDPPTPTPPPEQPEDEADEADAPPPSDDDTEDANSYEVPLEPSEGDPGDEYEPSETTSKRKRSASPQTLGNAGCSAAPGGAAGSGLPILGALFAANVLARRARRRPNA